MLISTTIHYSCHWKVVGHDSWCCLQIFPMECTTKESLIFSPKKLNFYNWLQIKEWQWYTAFIPPYLGLIWLTWFFCTTLWWVPLFFGDQKGVTINLDYLLYLPPSCSRESPGNDSKDMRNQGENDSAFVKGRGCESCKII